MMAHLSQFDLALFALAMMSGVIWSHRCHIAQHNYFVRMAGYIVLGAISGYVGRLIA